MTAGCNRWHATSFGQLPGPPACCIPPTPAQFAPLRPTLPGALQCRPEDCRDLVNNCIGCARRGPFKCAACNFGYKVVNNQVGCGAAIWLLGYT